MINRLTEYFVQPDGRWTEEDEYFVVSHESRYFFVDRETAGRLVRALDATPAPTWVHFTDLTGAAVSVRACRIEYVKESTFVQRAAEWRFVLTLAGRSTGSTGRTATTKVEDVGPVPAVHGTGRGG